MWACTRRNWPGTDLCTPQITNPEADTRWWSLPGTGNPNLLTDVLCWWQTYKNKALVSSILTAVRNRTVSAVRSAGPQGSQTDSSSEADCHHRLAKPESTIKKLSKVTRPTTHLYHGMLCLYLHRLSLSKMLQVAIILCVAHRAVCHKISTLSF